jgi:hypothetical protein
MGTLIASSESGSIENIAAQLRLDPADTLPKSVGDRVIMIVAAVLTCTVLVRVCVALIDRPVATWAHEHLGSD